MILALWIFMIFLGLIYPNSKKIAMIQIAFCSVLVALNVSNADYYKGLNEYNNASLSISFLFSGNIGFNLLISTLSTFLPYQGFLFAVSLLSLWLMYRGIEYYSTKVALVLSMYLIAPFTIDATQIKNFLATSVWLYYSRYLFSYYIAKGTGNDLKKYLLGCALAVLLHYIFLISLFFPIIKVFSQRNTKIIWPIIILTLVGLIIFNFSRNIETLFFSSKISILKYVGRKMYEYRINYRIGSVQTRLYLTILFYGMIFFLLRMIKKEIYRNNRKEYICKYYSFCELLTVITMICIPLMTFSMETYRIQRNMLLVYYILISVYGNERVDARHMPKKNALISAFGLGFVLFYFIVDSYYWNYDSVLKTLFKL